MDKEAARELVRELTAALEAPTPLQLVPIVTKAARLAAMVDDKENRTIFEFHLAGIAEGEVQGRRVSPLSHPDGGRILSLVCSDREAPNSTAPQGKTPLAAPLEELERALTIFEQELVGSGVSSVEAENFRSLVRIKTRIRNRVGVFVRNVATKLSDVDANNLRLPTPVGTKIFIGHGGSQVWMALRFFLKDRLGLECIEFNEASQAGNLTVDRLGQMLNEAGFAFIVATGEDKHEDGTLHARENVIHEAGLFQARLKFKRAIVLLEAGCAKFSNIHGLTHIEFPKGHIMAASEEIRRVLEREGFFAPAAV